MTAEGEMTKAMILGRWRWHDRFPRYCCKHKDCLIPRRAALP